jgi:anti-anti-sigma regulatory factor
MIESTDSTFPTYEQTQHVLFKQILDAVKLAAAGALVLSLGALFLPAAQITSLLLLAGLVALQFGIVLISSQLMRRERARAGALFFMIMTMVNGTLVAVVLGFPVFAAVVSSIMIAVCALLIGPRYAFAPGVIGILLFGALSIVDRQGWLAGITIAQESWTASLIRIGFVTAALVVLMIVCARASDRLQRSASEAQARADEAAYLHSMQVTLNEQVWEEIDEQRRLMAVIQELEAPIMPIRTGALVLPLVGHLDGLRLEQIERRLLQRVFKDHSDLVLIDVTGVPQVDAVIADGLVRLGQAVRLLGAGVVLTGTQPATAQALAELGADLSFVRTYATLQDALAQIEWKQRACL